jgi:hydrogenase expression/formation protein HypC
MCLAIPARIVSIGEFGMAEVDILGVTRKVSLDLVPDAVANDHVLVHAGFAIQVVSEDEAQETLDLLMQMDMFADDQFGGAEIVTPGLTAEEVQ